MLKSLVVMKDALYLLGAIATIITLLISRKSNFQEILAKEKQRNKYIFFAYLKAIVSAYKLPIIVVFISMLIAISIELIAITDSLKQPFTASVETTAKNTPSASLEVDAGDVWLDEIDPILPNTEAVITNEWDPLTKISVNGVPFEHGIGFFIPKEKQDAYLHDHNSEQITHSESIEYSLANKYQTLYFDYGIDDSSFTSDATSAPACIYWIVVQSLSSNAFANSDENILFQTEKMNYRTVLHNSGEIDVSKAEAIRITVYWKFSVSQTKPFAMNIALVNPILYAVKD